MNKIVNKYKEFKIDGNSLFCVVCEHHINYTKSHGKNRVEEHVKSQKHNKNKELKHGKPQQSLIAASFHASEQHLNY